ncbi:hypothetical protein [Pseudorhodoplanes sp.]|jgi:hypothetical protein|uniref:hypothetical protein n=1 Tax=Pseudorhodoplanes sp. TaxID=1934341 RepID=UPI002D12F5B0|nr:hypothetical protein [Pseudorhodoplanes sp.]HWV40730.1 hypothetical protein [Pseudorhodoplanes sp.]
MTRNRVAGIGFQHPLRNARPLTKRKLAFAHLLMTAVLVICIIVAVTAVAIGSARADTLAAIITADEGVLPLAILLGLLFAGFGAMTAAFTRRH